MGWKGLEREPLDYILTDLLPVELSDRFSFYPLYEFLLKKENRKILNSLTKEFRESKAQGAQKIFDKGWATQPLKYKIIKGIDTYREMSLIQPFSALNIYFFIQCYQKEILQYLKKNHVYSIRYHKNNSELSYKESDKKRTQFDLDHVLDKGRCPLVALSLYNLVPACPTCNGPHIKGKRVMNVTLEQRKKLSPSSTLYDFENQVKIWIRPKTGKIRNTNFLKYMDDYDLDFDTSSDADYENEIDFLYLRERYNYHKCEALRLADLKVKYTSSKIKEIARIICNIGKEEQKELTPIANIMTEQIRRDIFGLEFSNEHHRTFHKLRKDILDFKDEE